MIRASATTARAALLGFALLCVSLSAAAQQGSAAGVRLGFMFNFSKFAVWPEGTFAKGAPVRFCLASGDEAMSKEFKALESGELNGLRVSTRTLSPASDPRDCQVLFIPAAHPADQLEELLTKLDGSPTLTVSDGDGFVRRGGMIELVYTSPRYQFDISYVAAKRAGLQLSSNLLKLARNVK